MTDTLLPLARPADRSPAPGAARPAHLLVVGDAGVNALRPSGDARYAVDHVSTAREALSHLPARRSAIVVTELDLPDGDGAELCGAVKARSQASTSSS